MTPTPSSTFVSPPRPLGTPGLPATFAGLYLHLLRPQGHGGERLQAVRAAALSSREPSAEGALEQCLTQLTGRTVRLSAPQRQAFQQLATMPDIRALSPWSTGPRADDVPEMVSAAGLYDIYLALLKPDGHLMQRFKGVQAAAALYEPGAPGSGGALEQELTRLGGRPVQLSETQLRCFKELLVDEPAFAHIAPWEDLTASW